MKNFIKTTLVAGAVVLGLAACQPAQANTAEAVLDANVASSCTVNANSAGTMLLQGTNVSTDAPAMVYVQNNEAGAYKVFASDAGDFSAKPNAYTGTATLTTSFSSSGVNNGSVASGAELPLANAGIDALSISVSGTTNELPVAGDYQATSTVTCVAQ